MQFFASCASCARDTVLATIGERILFPFIAPWRGAARCENLRKIPWRRKERWKISSFSLPTLALFMPSPEFVALESNCATEFPSFLNRASRAVLDKPYRFLLSGRQRHSTNRFPCFLPLRGFPFLFFASPLSSIFSVLLQIFSLVTARREIGRGKSGTDSANINRNEILQTAKLPMYIFLEFNHFFAPSSRISQMNIQTDSRGKCIYFDYISKKQQPKTSTVGTFAFQFNYYRRGEANENPFSGERKSIKLSLIVFPFRFVSESWIKLVRAYFLCTSLKFQNDRCKFN